MNGMLLDKKKKNDGKGHSRRWVGKTLEWRYTKFEFEFSAVWFVTNLSGSQLPHLKNGQYFPGTVSRDEMR